MRYSTTSEFYLNSTSSLQWVTFLLHLIILNSIFFICIGLSLYLCDIKFLLSIWPSQSPCNKVQRWVFLEQNLSRLGCLEFMNLPYFWFWVAFKSCTMPLDQSHCPNVSTTPITAMGCRQCLPLSVVKLKGKHCRKPHCVDTFGPSQFKFKFG